MLYVTQTANVVLATVVTMQRMVFAAEREMMATTVVVIVSVKMVHVKQNVLLSYIQKLRT